MNRTQKIFGLLIVVGLLIVGFLVISRRKGNDNHKQFCYQSHCFTLEIADTPQERMQGLMYRTSLASNAGMIFIFPDNDIHAFWMKNTLIPLDMVWLDSGFIIIDVKEAIPCTSDPCTIYQPQGESSYVIELAGGTAKNIGLLSGQKFLPR